MCDYCVLLLKWTNEKRICIARVVLLSISWSFNEIWSWCLACVIFKKRNIIHHIKWLLVIGFEFFFFFFFAIILSVFLIEFSTKSVKCDNFLNGLKQKKKKKKIFLLDFVNSFYIFCLSFEYCQFSEILSPRNISATAAFNTILYVRSCFCYSFTVYFHIFYFFCSPLLLHIFSVRARSQCVYYNIVL